MLRRQLNSDPQGTLILTSDFAGAGRIFRMAEPALPDLYIGELPSDARAFNAVCVCPPEGEIPAGYKRIILAGMPEEYPLKTDGEVFALRDQPAWMKLLPDIEDMRNAWRALVKIGKRPVIFKTMDQLAHLVCAETEMDPRTAVASLLTMHDLELIRLDLSSNPIAMMRNETKKANPESSPVWQTIQRWRSR